jgi:cell division inhibitor SepF
LPSWLERVLHFIGFSDNYDEEEDDDSSQLMEERVSRKRAPVLSLHSSPDLKIVVVSPLCFEEAEKLASHLKNRRPLIVNFNNAPKDEAQRIIDFLSGAAYGLSGSTRKVTADTFLFIPSNFSIYTEDMSGDLRERLLFKWDQGGMRDRLQEKG